MKHCTSTTAQRPGTSLTVRNDPSTVVEQHCDSLLARAKVPYVMVREALLPAPPQRNGPRNVAEDAGTPAE